jgi:hypothetical protein
VPHPDALPDLFLDRSLGRIRVPQLLREAGLTLVTLAERYGVPADEKISDEKWLSDCGKRQEVVLMKDTRIRYNLAEKAAINRFHVRCFCLRRQNLTGDQMAETFLRNLSRIVAACDEPGPFLYAVYADQMRKIPI